jgi:hypothetical protein
VWLLFNKEEPSVFVDILKSIDVPVAEAVTTSGMGSRVRQPPPGKKAIISQKDNADSPESGYQPAS